MNKVNLLYITILLFVGCASNENDSYTVTVCECQTLFEDYSNKKLNADSKEEKLRLSKEELSKNIECAKLEKSLGENLTNEIAKCP